MTNIVTDKQKIELGSAIRSMRKVLKKHQSEIAYGIGATQAMISSWELGKTFPDKTFHSGLIRYARQAEVFLPHLNDNKNNIMKDNETQKLIQIFYKNGFKDVVRGTVEHVIHLLNGEEVFLELVSDFNKKIIINKNEIINIKEIKENNNDR